MTSSRTNIRSVVAAISGNFVEWYDFALYLFLAPVIAQQFFPPSGTFALLGAFTLYAVSFFFRPLGAIIFGHIGDVYGRRHALRLSLSCLAGFSILIAFLPTYHTIGPVATLLLCLCRIGQGICLGGEFAGSMIYLGEMAGTHRKSFYTSLCNNGSNLGLIAAATSATCLSYWMTESQFTEYGYRILFFLGGLVGVIGFAFRADLKETTPFEQNTQHVKIPIISVIKEHRTSFMQLFCVLIISALGCYMLMGYLSTFLQQSLQLSLHTSLRYESVFLGITLFLVPLFATIADKTSPRQMLIWACWVYIVLAIPSYYLLYTFQQPLFLVPILIAFSMEQSCVPALMSEYFPVSIRYTGVSLTYNIAMALIGGLSPLMGQLFIGQWHMYYGIAYILMIGSVLALLFLQQQSATKKSMLGFHFFNNQ